MKRIENAGALLLIVNILILGTGLATYFELGLDIEFFYFIGLFCWLLQTIASFYLATASQSNSESYSKAANIEIERIERRRRRKNKA